MFKNSTYVPTKKIMNVNDDFYIGDQKTPIQKRISVKPGKYKIYIKSLANRITDIKIINQDAKLDELDSSDWMHYIDDNFKLSSNKIYIGNNDWKLSYEKFQNIVFSDIEDVEIDIYDSNKKASFCIATFINAKDIKNDEYQIQKLISSENKCLGLLIHLW